MRRFAVLALVGILGGVGACAQAEPPAWVPNVINRIPRTDAELKAAHAASEANAALEVPAGQPLEVPNFGERVTHRLGDAPPRRRLRRRGPTSEVQASRTGVLSLGMEMAPEDQANLPYLSGSTILGVVNTYYVGIQARIEREPDGAPYLFHRAMGAVALYSDPRKTQASTELVGQSLKELRGLGLLVPPGVEPEPEQLRTLVIVNRSTLAVPVAGQVAPQIKQVYELMFLRARVTGDERNPQVTVHAFGTSDERERLHYYPPYVAPTKVDECGITATIFFTEYGFGGIVPSAKATRKAVVRSRSSFSAVELDNFSAKQGQTGGWLDHATETLDAIIDGRLVPKETNTADRAPTSAR